MKLVTGKWGRFTINSKLQNIRTLQINILDKKISVTINWTQETQSEIKILFNEKKNENL